MSGLCFYLLFVKLIENVNVPFSVVVLGAFGTRFVKQAVLCCQTCRTKSASVVWGFFWARRCRDW